jgi:hypothetical protein
VPGYEDVARYARSFQFDQFGGADLWVSPEIKAVSPRRQIEYFKALSQKHGCGVMVSLGAIGRSDAPAYIDAEEDGSLIRWDAWRSRYPGH